jgi:ribosomal protein S4
MAKVGKYRSAHRGGKLSEYGLQLRAKRKLRGYYAQASKRQLPDAGVEKLVKGETAVVARRVHGLDGRLTTIYAVDMGSSTLGNDLRYAFAKNTAKARRENKKKTGAADAAVPK